MTIVLPPPERATQTVILRNISWETYERLLIEAGECNNPRFTYDRGTLEIMILSLKHEKLKHFIATLIELIAGTLSIDVEGTGSTTFSRQDLERGFEPDASFYFCHLDLIRHKDEIDLTSDPPPDLVIEIDISSPSLKKFPIFASLGIPEVWRYDGRELTIFQLIGDEYRPAEASAFLPGLTGAELTRFINQGKTTTRAALLNDLQAWAEKRAED